MPDNTFFLTVANSYIYYSNLSSDGELFKIDINGNKVKVLDNTQRTIKGSWLSSDNNYIFYSNDNDYGKLYKYAISNNAVSKVIDDICGNISVDETYIYYNNYSDHGYQYKIKKDGTGKTKNQ